MATGPLSTARLITFDEDEEEEVHETISEVKESILETSENISYMNNINNIHREAILKNLSELQQLDKDVDDIISFAICSVEQQRDKTALFSQLQHYIPDRMKKLLRVLDTTQIAFANIVENQAGVIDQLGDELALTLNQPVTMAKRVYSHEMLQEKKSLKISGRLPVKCRKISSINREEPDILDHCVARVDLSKSDWHWNALSSVGISLPPNV